IIDFSGTLQVFEFPRSGGALSAMEDAGESDLLFKIQRQFVRFFYDNRLDCLWLGDRLGNVLKMPIGEEVVHAFRPHEQFVFAIEDMPISGAIATADLTRRVRITSKSGELIDEFRVEFPLREIAVSPNERFIAVCGESRLIEVFDRHSKASKRLSGHSARVLNLKFLQDGSRLASSAEDGTVILWDTSNWQEIVTLQKSTGHLNDLEFSADQQKLVVASASSQILIWEAPNRPLVE
ncbi:MAG: hypothetical protein AAF802_02360, partial [Planctomycetota bacterium]